MEDFRDLGIPTGSLINHLRNGRVLDIRLGGRMFVLSREDHLRYAHAHALTLSEEGPAYAVMFSALDLRALTRSHPGVEVMVGVFDLGQRFARVGSIRANRLSTVTLRTAVALPTGDRTTSADCVLIEDLRRGDVFATGETAPDEPAGSTLFRVLDAHDRSLWGVRRHVVTPGWDDLGEASQRALTSDFAVGPDGVLFRIPLRPDDLAHIGMRGLASSR